MKKILIRSLFISFAIIFSFCSKDKEEDTPKTTAIEISVPSSFEISSNESKNITIKGGDGKNYAVSVEDESVATASIQGNTLSLQPKSQGETTIKITSADKEFTFVVKVTTPEITLSETGILFLFNEGTSSLTVGGGNGVDYEVNVEDEKLISFTKEGNEILITAKDKGETKLTIKSAGQTKELNVKIYQKETKVGVYLIDGSGIIPHRYRANRAGGVTLVSSLLGGAPMNQYISINPVSSANLNLNQNIEYTFGATKEVSEIPSGTVVTAKVFHTETNLVWLLAENYMIVARVN